ncbi:MAG: YkvA family protein, partial [Candidatus Limnocylindrales bacterium]
MARIRRPLRQVNLARTLNLIAFLPLASRAPVYGRLIWSLLRDDRVPPAQKAVLAVAMGYVVLPIDLLPDRLPILGVVDDVAVAVIAIDLFLEGVPATLLDEKLVELGIE